MSSDPTAAAIGLILVCIGIGLLGGLALGHGLGESRATKLLHCEAVKVGAGKWSADENGNVMFSWVTPSAK
jgi:hypothetical protein